MLKPVLDRALDLAAAASIGLGVIVLAGPLWPFLDLFRHVWPLTLVAGLAALGIVLIRPSRFRVAAALLGSLLSAAPGMSAWFSHADASPATGPEIVIATHNLWGRRHDPLRARDVLMQSNADVVLLQEAWASGRLANGAFAQTYPHRAACRNSTRIHARYPILSSGCIEHPAETDWQNSTLCELDLPSASWAEIEHPSGRTFFVVSVHMDWPAPLGVQACERENFARELQRFPQDRLIVAGDFNAASPSAALERMERALDLQRRSRGIATWPSEGLFDWQSAIVPTPLIGIDHVFAGPDWQTVEVWRGEDTGSDHRPLMARLKLYAP